MGYNFLNKVLYCNRSIPFGYALRISISLVSYWSASFFFFSFQVRKGDGVSNDEILGFAKLFNDELTLDNVSRLFWFPGVSVCRNC